MIAAIEPPVAVVPAVTPQIRLAELQKTISASRLNLWAQCRLKLFFRYVLRAEKPPSASMHAGKVVHAILQNWNLARWRRQPFQIEALKTLFETRWQEQEGKRDDQQTGSSGERSGDSADHRARW